ncbi:MAG: hypothetical protein J0I29_00970 [Rhizobiales bacterium]|nr:hypothetical protein [Hyphomicrobiales bacterium]
MSTMKQAQQPTLTALIAYYLSNIFASPKPQYTADDIAAAIACGGNPPGV